MRDSPILRDYYSTAEMRPIWTEENMVQKWLDIEAAVAKAQGKLGIIPSAHAATIAENCNTESVKPARIAEIRAIGGHTIVSMITALAEQCGPSGEYIHLGPTTQDILDTGLTLQMREAYKLLFRELSELEAILLDLANREKKTLMIGRTEGQHGVPITFGFKVAILASEIRAHMERLKSAADRVFYVTMTGACGTQASFVLLSDVEQTQEFHRLVAANLGLKCPVIDLHHRTDRFAEVVNVLALICSTLGEAGLEIRDLQRTEVAEVEEPFDSATRHTSSTMANKRNPEPSEFQEGLAKLARSNAIAMMDIQQQHERDITRMAVEFACIPESFLVCSAALATAKRVYGGLIVRAERMRTNAVLQGGIAMSEAILLRLAQKIGKKLTAHDLVRRAAMRAFETGGSFSECLREDSAVRENLSEAELTQLLDPACYLGTASRQVEALITESMRLRATDS